MYKLTVQEVRKLARTSNYRIVKQNAKLNGMQLYCLVYQDSDRVCVSNMTLDSAYDFLTQC